MSSSRATLPTRSAPTEIPQSGKLRQIEKAIERSIHGKPEAVRMAIVCLLSRGHLLIEDVPGVGKTTLAQSLARSVDGEFHRLQFTSDMLPSDVLGVSVYNSQAGAFEFKPGPVFTNFLLADEINRTTPKTQSALLEAMNEQHISVEGRTLPLPEPFMVIATQNPSHHQGTYPLPESQLDRFLMRIRIGYPDPQSERDIIRQTDGLHGESTPCVLSRPELTELQSSVQHVSVDEAIVGYMLAIIERTRTHENLSLGVSPRGSQALYRAVQAHALVDGRTWALPDDVKLLAPKVLAHRIMATSRAGFNDRRTSAEQIIEEILNETEVPL
jgi:MoxR-like ATPase